MKWYYAESGQQKGPVEDAALDDLVRAGVVRDDTLVWHEGLPSWQTHSSLRGSRPADAILGPVNGTGASFCSECGRPFPQELLVKVGNAAVCAECKPIYLQKLREGVVSPAGQRHYAGFWIRFVARLIDSVLLTIVVWMVGVPLLALGHLSPGPASVSVLPVLAGVSGLATLLQFALNVGYEVYFVSTRGGTIGKLVLGLRIIRADGSKVSASLAAGRYFAEIISGLILMIGFIMAGFDSQKRALHDRICDTRVIYAA